MSLEAIGWVLRDAPGVPVQCVSVLIGLADHADSHGRGAYAGQKLLAGYARKSDRSVRNDLGAPFRVRFVYVDSIPNLPSGKYEEFRCELA
jgi:hypothetical protein